MTQKSILVVCGTSVATSTVVQEALKERLPDRGVQLGSITKAKASEAPAKTRSGTFDLVVTTTALNEDRIDVPVIHTTAFMTGMGEEEVLDEIATKLED